MLVVTEMSAGYSLQWLQCVSDKLILQFTITEFLGLFCVSLISDISTPTSFEDYTNTGTVVADSHEHKRRGVLWYTIRGFDILNHKTLIFS